MIRVSDRARRLIAALHEPFSNEDRWQIAQQFLDEEKDEIVRLVEETFYMEGSAKERQSGLNPETPQGVAGSSPVPSAMVD